jgi:uncharacterized repeat protein (TIGR02543 family)
MMVNKLTRRSTGRLTGALAFLLALCLIAGGIIPAYATEPPPEMPHQFYGTVCFDGDPVAEATLVEAFVDDVKQAQTTVDGEGRYGYDTVFRVSGTAGATVTFRVGGIEADEDAAWESGKVQELNLTIHEEPAPPVQYELAISSTAGGSVTIPGEGVFTYYAGAQVQLLAEPEAGHQFVGWEAPAGTFSDEATQETTFTMPTQSVTVTASFEEVPVPTVTTHAATDVTSYLASVHMSYTVGNLSSVELRFACKRCTDSAWFYTDWVSRTADGTYAEVLTGLASQTGYEFKAQLRNVTVIEGVTSRFCTARGAGVGLGDLSCPVATAAYGTRTAERLHVLREFRDVVLLQSAAGSHFVALYYRLSPPVADFIASRDPLRTLVKDLLVDPIVWMMEAAEDIWQNQGISESHCQTKYREMLAHSQNLGP